MGKQLLLIIGAVVLLGGGGFAVWQLQNDTDETSEEQASEQQVDESELAFVAEAMTNTAYVATISGQSPEGPIDAVMEHDGNDRFRFSTQQDGISGEFIITPTATYTCQDGQCMEFAQGQQSLDIDPRDFSYDEGDLEEFSTNAVRVGTEPCPTGTCNVWEITDEDEVSRIYVDTDSSRIAQVTGSGADGEFTITYEYRDVTIDIPENVQPMPTFDQ